MEEGSSKFRVAHLSDLHIASEAERCGFHDKKGLMAKSSIFLQALYGLRAKELMSSFSLRYLRALTRSLSTQHSLDGKAYDCFLVTGDLATTGEHEDISEAKKLFSGGYIPGSAEGLANAGLKIPYHRLVILPGNHDRYIGRWLTPKSTNFESKRHFGRWWKIDNPEHSAVRSKVNFTVLEPKGKVTLAIVSADFALTKTPYIRFWRMWGCGNATQSIIDEMVKTTKKLVEEGHAVIWATHFPPVAPKVSRLLRLSRHKSVIRAAELAKVNVIFSGHTHEANSYHRASDVRIICAGSPCGAGDGERSFFDVELEVRNRCVTAARVTKMLYTERPARAYQGGFRKRGDFVPVV